MNLLSSSAWPLSRSHEALEAIARHIAGRPSQLPPPPSHAVSHPQTNFLPWLLTSLQHLGLEGEPVDASYPEVAEMIQQAAPAVLYLETGELLLLIGARRSRVMLLGPDGHTVSCSLEAVRAALTAPLERRLRPGLEAVLHEAGLEEKRRQRAMQRLFTEQLAEKRIEGVTLVRLPPHAPFLKQLLNVRAPQRLLLVLLFAALRDLLEASAWVVLGRGALGGRLEPGWLFAWALLLLTLLPLQVGGSYLSGMLSVSIGRLLKSRLLDGALKYASDDLRTKGIGHLLGRVIDATAMENLAFSGGFLGLTALVEVIIAGAIMSAGAGARYLLLAVIFWTGFTVVMCYTTYKRQRKWTGYRLDLTHDLIERMVGHRTRLAQEPRDQWHEEEDALLSHYLEASQGLDRLAALIAALLPRGWLLIGFACLAPAWLLEAPSASQIAVAVGGILLAHRALSNLWMASAALARAIIAWDLLRPLYAASRAIPGPSVFLPRATPGSLPLETEKRPPVLEARELLFGYRADRPPVLDRLSLTLLDGEQVLLEGESGSGKTTLAALLGGLRAPSSGLLLLHGLDRTILGPAAWRERIAVAPAFHENHVLAAPLAFNLLMARDWPATEEDLLEAETICEELGLKELLASMPGGLTQVVGETGWTLSHGERGRLYLARALLQRADLVILDESFAALDPETLIRCMQCVRRRARTLLAIVHP